MKIKIDTTDVLGDESTIRDEVIDKIVSDFKIEIRQDGKDIIKDKLEKALNEIIQEKVFSLVSMHLDTEYTEKDRFGRVGKKTTIRNRIADILRAQCVFKKTNYSSDRNAFTAAVLDTVSDEMKKFRKDYISLVNDILIQECLDEASKKLKAACGIVDK